MENLELDVDFNWISIKSRWREVVNFHGGGGGEEIQQRFDK